MENSHLLNVLENNLPYLNYTTDYVTEYFENGTLHIIRNRDVKIPDFLQFETIQQLNIEEFNNLIKNIYFEFYIGGRIIFEIPLRFMIHLKETEFYDNKFHIKIPFKMFCDEINLIVLRQHRAEIKLKNIETNMFLFYSLTSLGIIYNNYGIQNRHDFLIEQIIQELNILEITQHSENISFNFEFDGYHKGFFIECNNVDEINEIIFKANNYVRFEYDKYLIKSKCIKISQKLLYLPLNFDKSYLDITNSGFDGSFNLSRTDTLKMIINFNIMQVNICFYGIGTNILIYQGGMGGLRTERKRFTHTNLDLQQQSIINKKIDENKKYCAITFEDILDNMKYINCIICKNNFNEKALTQWFQHNSHKKTCPYCRSIWKDFNIYVNN